MAKEKKKNQLNSRSVIVIVLCFAILLYMGIRFVKKQSEINAKQAHLTERESVLESLSVANEEVSAALKDGDTEPFEIRLYGIDAPERGQEYAKQSREELIKLIRNKSIRVEVMDADRYGRTVAKVFRNGLYINLELLKRGLAWFYSYHAGADDELRQAQEYARAHKNGLWQSDTPISPRKRRKSNPSTRHKGVK